MIQLSKIEFFGFSSAIRGMRNPYDSWEKGDSTFDNDNIHIGENDMKLCKQLIKAGGEHRKFLRSIHVQMDIKAPFYWWKEYDTYKVGTVANSCSTMHTITRKPFTMDDFSFDCYNEDIEKTIVKYCNELRDTYLVTKDKIVWRRLIECLPMSYNQTRTVDVNYEVLYHMYMSRKMHKLQEWRDFCAVIAELPYFKEFFLEESNEGD